MALFGGLQSSGAHAAQIVLTTALAIFVLTAGAQSQSAHDSSQYGCDQRKALSDYVKDLAANPHSSIADYCLAGLLLEQREYQASMNAYRDALRGDGDPSWTKVWSYVQMGKIFDLTQQRERAVAQYQLAIQTGDNTQGAVDRAQELLAQPFPWPTNE
jgi:tetratricopeptide (TPR) repeat protein